MTYRPGWRIVFREIGDRAEVQVNYEVLDSVNQTIRPLSVAKQIPFGMDQFSGPVEEVFLAWLVAFFGEIELHERDEWLRVNGKRLREPHPVGDQP